MKNIFLNLVLIASLISCKNKETFTDISPTLVGSQKETSLENKVLENTKSSHKITIKQYLSADAYAYLEVSEQGKEDYWMAVPNQEITIGSTYYYDGGMLMKDFKSKTLDKTFDFIIFAEGVRTDKQAKSIPKAKPIANTKVENIQIKKAEGAISLKELFSNKASFADKNIKVTGKVVKVNNGIMNKNWVHIIDGTSSEGLSDLTITTLEKIELNTTLTLEGKVTLDKDFGGGYHYDILLEDAKKVQ